MLGHLPLGAQPLLALAGASVATDDTFIVVAFDDDRATDDAISERIAYESLCIAAPLADAPVITDDTFIAITSELELADSFDADTAFEAWIASPFDDAPDAPPPPPPQPGPLSALGGAGWFAEVPPSRRKKQKPTWPNLPATPPGAEHAWRLVTVTRETARLRIHRSAKAMRAKLKRETSLEDHVIAGIVAALIADQDKDD